MSWESAENIADPMGYYKSSFGNAPDGTVYDDGTGVSQDFIDMVKAVNIGAGTGTAGFLPSPVVYDPMVTDITRLYTPIQTIVPRVTNVGQTAAYFRFTDRGTATWGAELPELNESDSTRESVSKAIKFLRITGRVSNVAISAGKHFESALQEEIKDKNIAMIEAIEDGLINGDGAGNNPDGFRTLFTANNTAVGGSITMSDINDLLDDCYDALGRINLLVTDARTLTAIRQQMQDFVRYESPVKVGWGMDSVSIASNHGMVPMVTSQAMPSASGSREILAMDVNMAQQRVLLEQSYQPLAQTDDSTKFYMRTYRQNIYKHTEGAGKLTGITD